MPTSKPSDILENIFRSRIQGSSHLNVSADSGALDCYRANVEGRSLRLPYLTLDSAISSSSSLVGSVQVILSDRRVLLETIEQPDGHRGSEGFSLNRPIEIRKLITGD